MGPCFEEHPLFRYISRDPNWSIHQETFGARIQNVTSLETRLGSDLLESKGSRRVQNDLNQRAQKRQFGIKNTRNCGLKHIQLEIKGG